LWKHAKRKQLKYLVLMDFILEKREFNQVWQTALILLLISYTGSKDFYTELITFLNKTEDNLYFEIVCAK
jgi:hypothetical protein